MPSQDIQRLHDFALDQLEVARSGLLGDGDDLEVIGAAEHALAALRMLWGGTEPTPEAITELTDPFRPKCICAPEMVARGGYRGSCRGDHGEPINDGQPG